MIGFINRQKLTCVATAISTLSYKALTPAKGASAIFSDIYKILWDSIKNTEMIMLGKSRAT